MTQPKQHAARLLARTEDDGGCLIWRGALAGGAYPSAKVNGKATLVRRVLWSELKGAIQPGHVVHHTCNTPRCVNPDHLATASHQAFCALIAKAGAMGGVKRSAAIAKAWRAGPGAKLTQAGRDRIVYGNETTAAVAKALGISQAHASKVRRQKCWRDFSSPFLQMTA